MAKPSSSLYSVSKTFFWFAIVSIILTACLAAIVMTDYTREWKSYQKQFVRLKLEQAKKKLGTAQQGLDSQKMNELKASIEKGAAALQGRRNELRTMQRAAEVLDSKLSQAKTQVQDLKQFEDSYQYTLEEARRHHDSKAAEYEAKLKALALKSADAKKKLENFQKEREDLETKLQEFTAAEHALQKKLDKILEETTRYQMQVEKLKPSIAKEILNAPMLDFIAPSLRVQQVVLEDLTDDFHFAKVQKVDRCITCHLGIDHKDFSAESGEVIPQPFRAHPHLELYVGSNSPHPIEKFGCTVCHGGNGHSIGFKDSAHMPQSPEQGEGWRKKYHWEALEKWDAKMLPLNRVQASCAKCHNGVVEVPRAERLNEGRGLAQRFGCVNCHKIQGYEDSWKVGASLEHVQSKLSKDWIVKWLQDPKSFRPSTKMPRTFHLSNNASQEDIDRDNAAIQSIAAYLMKNSEPVTLTATPVPGDAANGEKLVKEIGCLGCHGAAGMKLDSTAAELSSLGSKVSPEWLYTWLKDPKHYIQNTRMPNLRLTDQQAADITSYLMKQKNEEFEKVEPPAAKTEVVDAMILESLQGVMRRKEAEVELGTMGQDERLEYLGQRSIAHQGCFTCHAIKGFEDTKPIGADLSDESRKDIHQFDFGFVDIEHTRQAWIQQKLKDPRIYDHGKIKSYYDRLRMPQFNFSESQIDALTTFVMSLTQERIPLEMQKRLDSDDVRIEKGRLLVRKLNCTGCHTLDGHQGSLRKYHDDQGTLGQAPPVLDGEGAKVQERWLHEFLKEPSAIRPWLTVHMPSFGLSDEELKILVEYFTLLTGEQISYHGENLPASDETKLGAGKELFDKLQCVKCHQLSGEGASMDASFLAPDISMTKKRLKPEWVRLWIEDPQKLDPGTLMPGFFPDGQTAITDVLGGDAKAQIEAIRDYLYRYEKSEQ